MKVCRECAIINSHLGSIVDTRVACRPHSCINLPLCSSLQALFWLSTEGGVRHQVTRLRGAKTGDQICRPPTSSRGAGPVPSQEPDRPEPKHSDQAQHAIISQVPQGKKHALTVSLRELIAARSFKYTIDTLISQIVVVIVKLTYRFFSQATTFLRSAALR